MDANSAPWLRVLRKIVGPAVGSHVEIYHDADCPHWRGLACSCDFFVACGPLIDAKYG